MSVDLTVVVPAYNEERRLAPTLAAIRAYLDGAEGSTRSSAEGAAEGSTEGARARWELIVVDDGSTDATLDIAADAEASDPRVQLIRSPRNLGKGHALRLGVLASRGDRVLITDADLATPIEELECLDKALTDGHTAAIGSRARPGATIESHQHRLRELLGRTGNFLIRTVAVPGVRDTQCGFKLFDGDRAREAFAASRLRGWGIDVEILQYFHRSGWPVAEVPVRWAHQEGSKVRPFDYVKVLAELTSLKIRTVPRRDLLVAAIFLSMAVVLYSGRLIAPDDRYLPDSLQDQNQWEWFFAVTADNIRHLHNPLFTTLQNYPDGVNLMANTVMLGLSVPFAPVTWLFGPAVALNAAMTLGLAATAVAWYWLILKRLVRHRGAAAVGAALAAFAPPMISHAHAHPNFMVLFMIPLIIDRTLRLCEGEDADEGAGTGRGTGTGTGTRVVRDGVVLGLFTTYQIFLGEEPLLLAALGLLLFAAAYGIARKDVARAAIRPLARGLGVAVAVTVPLVAFPLYWQFFGPQSYTSVLHGDGAGNSPLALLSFSERSLAGSEQAARALAQNPTEQNAFYGWPLIALAFAIVVRLWERAVVKALAFTAIAAAFLSLGPKFRIPMTEVVLPGPWAPLAHAPLFESVIESRVAMVCAPALGMLIALALARLLAPAHRMTATRYAGVAAVALALLPIVPAPLRAVEREQTPAFIADGTWKKYLGAGESLVPVPLPDPTGAEALHWQTTADLDFRLPGGYFNGPWGPDRVGIYGASPRNTSNLLQDVRSAGRAPQITDAWRRAAREDLTYWNAGVLVLAPQKHDAALRETVDGLLDRPGKWVDGVWIWDLHGGS
ncbi:dolichyl-phosphate beta-glucosyltransferase [Streptomyces sp. NPDC058257]|uniref:dolichyl-phosphate beta-glucosyltransferase n=1 Tax=Streptomyces sp. NPDC058257 TaxID=3346409 RepID=UPI0036E886BC